MLRKSLKNTFEIIIPIEEVPKSAEEVPKSAEDIKIVKLEG